MGISTRKSSSKVTPVFDKEIKGAYGTLSNAYNAQAPKVTAAADKVLGLQDTLVDRVRNGNPAVNAATQYVTDTLGSNGTNPFLDQYIAQSENEAQNRVGAAVNKMGLGPAGSTYAGTVGREVGKVGLGMRYADWDAGQQRKAQAAGMAPGIAAGEAVGVAPLLGVTELGANLPMDAALKYAAGTGGLLGGYTNQANRDSPSTASQIGKGLKVAQSIFSMFSDERLKEDIQRVGKTDGGLGVYTYRYKGDPTPRMGVMAQEVEKKQPKALGDRISGFRTVDYGEVR